MKTLKKRNLKINPKYFCLANTQKCILYRENNMSKQVHTIPYEQEVPLIQISENKFVELKSLLDGTTLDKAKELYIQPVRENEIIVDKNSIRMFPYESNWINDGEVEVELLQDAYVYYKAKNYIASNK